MISKEVPEMPFVIFWYRNFNLILKLYFIGATIVAQRLRPENVLRKRRENARGREKKGTGNFVVWSGASKEHTIFITDY